MKTGTKSAFLLALLFLQMAGSSIAQQPVRLWSFARYRVHISTGVKGLIDTGRFYYSDTRQLTFDSSLEYFFYRVPTFDVDDVPDDYPDLNQWYTHRYHTIVPRVVAQFDSVRAWRYQATPSPNFQPLYSAKKTHTANRLDSLWVTGAYFHGNPGFFEFTYDQTGRPETCWALGLDTIILTRDNAGRVVRKKGQFIWGEVQPLTTIYHYDMQGRLDSVTSGVYRDALEHDALGRLRIVKYRGTSFYEYSDLDSFVYDGTSNRCTDIYQFTGNAGPNEHHAYTYAAAGQLASYARGNNFIRTFERNNAGYITEMTETDVAAINKIKTYYYYDSLGAAGINDVWAMSATIEIYPNPVNDKIFVQSVKGLSAYRICSVTGLEVQRGAMNGTQKSVSVEGLPPGTYVLYVQHQDGSRQAARVVKR